MKTLAYIAFGSLLLLTACGGSKSAANDDGGSGQAGSAAGSTGGTSGAASSDGGRGGSGASGSTGASGAGGTTSAGGGGGTAGGAACSTATTVEACDALSGCYTVYTAEPRTPVGSCTCPDWGCCSHFSLCASGAHATCTGPVLCKVVAPSCEPTFSVANDGSCYLGCVMSSACAP